MKIDNVKFKQKSYLVILWFLNVIWLHDTCKGICHMQANAYANGKLVAEAELIAQIAKKTVN
jgi:UDP-3-O-[3-hydroxymyristoyl] N-acetylglucosamine deacetylase/3-hydroxyacyl-[acyl-carrier-protein] dehydratase